MSKNDMSDRERFDLLFEAIAETRALANSNAEQIAEHTEQIGALRGEVRQMGQLVVAHMRVTQEHGRQIAEHTKQLAEQGREIRELAAIVREHLT